jgi:hypothetical protein
MCKHIFENKDVWEKDIAPLLLDLAYDKIINVRISLAKFINKVITKNKFDYLKNDDTIKKIVSILKKDKEEVSCIIEKLDIEIINVDLNINVNGKFIDNMNFVSKEFGITKNVPLESKIKKNSENEISTSTSSTNEEEKLEEGTPFQNEEEKKE